MEEYQPNTGVLKGMWIMSIKSIVRGMKGKSELLDFSYEQMHKLKVLKRKKMDEK